MLNFSSTRSNGISIAFFQSCSVCSIWESLELVCVCFGLRHSGEQRRHCVDVCTVIRRHTRIVKYLVKENI